MHFQEKSGRLQPTKVPLKMPVRVTMALIDLATLGYAMQIRIGSNCGASLTVIKASKASVTLRGILKESQVGSSLQKYP